MVALGAFNASVLLNALGLGYAKTWLNGNLTDTHELGQFVTFEERVLYDCVDVTAQIRNGVNAFGVMVGVGWFAAEGINVGPRQFLALLSVQTVDGSTVYYPSTLTASSNSERENEHAQQERQIQRDSTRRDAGGGEVAAAAASGGAGGGEEVEGGGRSGSQRPSAAAAPAMTIPMAFKATTGPVVFEAEAPAISPVTLGARIVSHKTAITTDASYSPISITEPVASMPGTFVVDFGQNMAGQVELHVRDCPAGTVISMQHTEVLYPNGLAHNQFCERPKYWTCYKVQFANYTCSGSAEEEVYRVTFLYMGFRYVQITGHPSKPTHNDVTAHFIHTDLDKSGSFTSSNEVLNKIQHATRYAAM
eukprot:gene17132-31839_t